MIEKDIQKKMPIKLKAQLRKTLEIAETITGGGGRTALIKKSPSSLNISQILDPLDNSSR